MLNTSKHVILNAIQISLRSLIQDVTDDLDAQALMLSNYFYISYINKFTIYN